MAAGAHVDPTWEGRSKGSWKSRGRAECMSPLRNSVCRLTASKPTGHHSPVRGLVESRTQEYKQVSSGVACLLRRVPPLNVKTEPVLTLRELIRSWKTEIVFDIN